MTRARRERSEKVFGREHVVVLKPEPRQVRSLLTRYANARIALAEKPVPAWQRELADVSQMLCAMTGKRSVTAAITAADEMLAAGRSRAPRRSSPTADAPLSA
ncbi:DUF5133 domain-containing protein [Streptomyces venezuelae]|uniref:DUF5133 domain-containing protein n=1 Tax=Streptomyces venezuelae TaxID=54571 RepID=UPI0029589C5A|nr:DUF5133 domain-containing protein [Streptomyces venezuelae]